MERRDDEHQPVGTVAELAIYPVKSCRSIRTDRARVGPTGLLHDRAFQVIDEEGGVLTQREAPHLALVQPTLVEGGLSLTCDGFEPLEVLAPPRADRACRTYLDLEVDVADAGNEAAAWFSAVAERPCRLVGAVAETHRRLPEPLDIVGHDLSFADVAPVLLTNEASLRDLQQAASEPFGMDRFRPNIVVAAADAWAEDCWRELGIGEATARVLLPWPRCSVPQVDQETAERHREPAVVLKRERWCGDASSLEGLPDVAAPFLVGNALFGVGCDLGPEGTTIRVGDRVDLIEGGPATFRPS